MKRAKINTNNESEYSGERINTFINEIRNVSIPFYEMRNDEAVLFDMIAKLHIDKIDELLKIFSEVNCVGKKGNNPVNMLRYIILKARKANQKIDADFLIG